MPDEKKPVEIILWTPHAAQKKILASPAKYKVINCGRQFGKTIFAVNYLLEEALTKEFPCDGCDGSGCTRCHKTGIISGGGRYWYIAPTYKQAKAIAWEILLAAVRALPPALVKKVNESELYVILGNNARVEIKGADNEDTLRGVALHGCVLDEYAFMRPNVFNKVILPMFNTTNGWCIFISTPNGFNHFYDLYISAKGKPDWDTFHFTSYDNPYASPEVLEEAKRELSDEAFSQEYLGEFRKKEGLVYKEFDRDKHVVTRDKWEGLQMIDTIAGIDFGFNNPSALVVIKKDFDNRYWIVDEWKKSRQTTTEVAEKCKNLESAWGINAFYPDPASPEHIEDIRRKGVNVRESNKDIKKGIEKVASLFKNNRLFIDASCTETILELESYSYPDKEARRGISDKNEAEKPVKENDHIVDALRYALFSEEPTQLNQFSDFNLYVHNYG